MRWLSSGGGHADFPPFLKTLQLGNIDPASPCADLTDVLARWGDGLAAYRACSWRDAIAGFEAALALDPGDGPSRMYIERCRHYLNAPPQDDWDGVWVLHDK